MNILAIDPGMNGGIAWSDGDRPSACIMPMAGKDIDLPELAALIRSVSPGLIVVEKVGAMPKQGVTSTFKFGKGYGSILGIAAALETPVELVTPQRWKGVVLSGTSKDKDAAIAYCRRMFPSVPLIPPRCRTPHDGIADALCIWEYGRRVLMGVAA